MTTINKKQLLILFIYMIILQIEGFQPTRNVSVDIDNLKIGNIKLYFVCPYIRLKTDVIKYFKYVENTPILLKEKQNAYGIILTLKDASDLGKYECSVISENRIIKNAALNIIDKKLIENPKLFIYKTEETIYITEKQNVAELSCGPLKNEPINWYRPPQYHIYSGSKYIINDIDQYSYGTYYCTSGPTNVNTVYVRKVILVKEIPKIKEKSIEEEVTYIETLSVQPGIVRYRSSNIAKSNDMVIWENPPGTILLDHGRDLYIQSIQESENIFFYRINRYGDSSINHVGKLIMSIKKQDNLMNLRSPVIYGGEIKMNCISLTDINNNATVVWRKNSEIISRENTLTIPSFKKEAFGKYSCEVLEGNEKQEIRFLNLLPEQKIESKIEMTPAPGNFYLFHSGSKKELHCEIGRVNNQWIMKAKDVIWTFNNKKIETTENALLKKVDRLDTNSVSILVLTDIDEKHEGNYNCYQGATVLSAKLLMERSDILIELAPPLQEVADNVNQGAELHCRIDTQNINSSSIFWKFIPEKSSIETELPIEAKVERPSLTSSTSFITINNVLKRHEGTYVCQVLNTKVFGKIIVRTKPVLKLSPKLITVKPGVTARFLCQLEGVVGKVIWRRMDKKSLTVNRENRLGGDASSILEIKHVTLNDHGTIYECVFNKLTEYATLNVEEECELNQRKCKNEICIDENKFCDGKDDCGDNSDEDRQRCNECSPNSIHCDFLNNSNPNKRCVIKHWQCDGIDDCGNNFDELNCPVKNENKCIGTHFLCNNNTLIPRSYWCDGEPDCLSMEDEIDCIHPQVIEPAKQMQISIFANSTLILTCKMSGRPIPTISWRFNWDHLPRNLNHNITTTISNCSIITSTLIIKDINTDHSGVYSCEGISRRRVMAPDFSVTVSKGLICQRPYYNNDAWYPEMCLRCYCSNVTDDCTSATGYITKPEPIESGIKPSDAAIVNFKTLEYYKPAREITFANMKKMKYFINETYYQTLVPNQDYYFGGAFNMGGSWLRRYGYPLIYKLKLSGESKTYIPNPMVMIKGETGSIYYCGVKHRLPVYASNENFENNIRIFLWEKDEWYKDYRCTISVSRSDIINVLKEVRLALFKVKYFVGQTDFQMSKLSMQEAIETKDKYSWVGNIEKCNCPLGFSGLSCEIKTE